MWHDVLNAITGLAKGDKVYLITKFHFHGKRDVREELNILMQKGFSRIV